MVLIDIVQIVPCVGVHDDTIDAQTAMGVDVVMLENLEHVLTVLDAPQVGIGLVELAELLVARLAGEALLVEALLVGVEGAEEAAQVGNVLGEGARAVAVGQGLALGVELQEVEGAARAKNSSFVINVGSSFSAASLRRYLAARLSKFSSSAMILILRSNSAFICIAVITLII